MARARNIKPSFFQNDVLGELSPIDRLAFIGMWTIADYKGCFEHRPKRLKVQLLPYDDCDFEVIANNLERSGFIQIYSVQGQRYIKIINFDKHQNPHKNEKESGSDIPDISEKDNGVNELNRLQINRDKNGTAPADSPFLIPDSPIPLPDSGIPLTPSIKNLPATEVAEKSSGIESVDLLQAGRDVWTSYSNAYFSRYSTEPVQNTKVRSIIKQFVQRIGTEEAPHVAAFYLSHNDKFYIQKTHPVDLLLKDAEGLRTQWATGRTMTASKATQIDRTANNLDTVNQAIEMMRARKQNATV